MSTPRATGPNARRLELLAAATRLVRLRGARVSMDELASAAGITKPILYRHFGDRAGLYRAIAEDWLAGLHRRLDDVVAANPNPRTLLRQMLEVFLHVIEEDHILYRAVVAEMPSGSDHNALVRGVGQTIAARLERFGVSGTRGAVLGQAVAGVISVVSDWWVETGACTRDELLDELVPFLWEGLPGAVARVGSHPPDVPTPHAGAS